MKNFLKKLKYVAIGIVALIFIGLAIFLMSGSSNHDSHEIGGVNTAFKMLGSDHVVNVANFQDPVLTNVVCSLSRAKTGGIKGSLGIAEDSADFDISCGQIGPIDIAKIPKDQQEVFNESRSITFKRLRVIRMFDAKYNTITYLAYSDKLVDGSPQNAISIVAPQEFRAAPNAHEVPTEVQPVVAK